MGRACFEISVELSQVAIPRSINGVLDLLRIATDFSAPLIQDLYFVTIGFWITEGMPDIRVFGDDTQRPLFSTPPIRIGMGWRIGLGLSTSQR